MYINSSLRQSGLTLIESLIVVILFGIVAAAAVPRFPLTNKPTIHNVLENNLNTLQTAIELYAVQHNGVYPGQVRHTDGLMATSVEEAKSAFEAQLLQYSDSIGRTSPRRTSDFPFGPYLTHGIPTNPLPPQSSDTTIVFDNSQVASVEQTGWRLILPRGEVSPIYPVKRDQ